MPLQVAVIEVGSIVHFQEHRCCRPAIVSDVRTGADAVNLLIFDAGPDLTLTIPKNITSVYHGKEVGYFHLPEACPNTENGIHRVLRIPVRALKMDDLGEIGNATKEAADVPEISFPRGLMVSPGSAPWSWRVHTVPGWELITAVEAKLLKASHSLGDSMNGHPDRIISALSALCVAKHEFNNNVAE